MLRRSATLPAVIMAAVCVGIGLGCTETRESPPLDETPIDSSTSSPVPTGTPLSNEEIDRLFQEDVAKPRAQGRIGPFVVTSGDWWQVPSCEEYSDPVGDLSESELYFGVPIDEENQHLDNSVRRCPDGTVLGIVSRPVSRSYFVGEPRVNFNFAPAERVKEITVSGFPGIIAEPFPYLTSPAALVVLERSPTDQRPGIVLHIDGTDPSEMKALAEEAIRNSSE